MLIISFVALTDRTNQVSLKAQQVQSGATDTTCNFNAGSDTYVEWYIQTSSSSYSSAMSSGSFKSASEFQSTLLKAFLSILSKKYASQISDLKFVSQSQAKNGDYIITFRWTFKSAITEAIKRTEIVTEVQTAYYEVIKTYFKTVSAKMNTSQAVKIDTPAPVVATSKKAIVNAADGSEKSIITGEIKKATLVSSSSSSSKSKSGNSGK